ncbi:RHS repeat domain-containing protein [Marixanthomonas ophiurae]|uniref:LysM domain-containing protein n=1 Tax=Marixanthomonas ophiurae TaxID=387659 RepID=A0A3E1Q9J5_9FLAO|nr:RHS repeat-associated core domain-containing protein [Marixanthomonas ophiurae]RFN58799.1 hypothetical protein DZ858_01585 [Marixanthomonas ophiurae]
MFRISNIIILLIASYINAQNQSRTLGNKSYEVSNHLGNVMTVVSDRKTPIPEATNTIIAFNDTDIKAFNDYYPYGMVLENRSLSEAEAHRYGFQGQEKDDEVNGANNSINYKYRVHDPRLGRFFAVDPLTSNYPHYSSYQFSGNKVIQYIELEGLEEGNVVSPNTYTMKEGDTFWSLEEAWGMEHGTLISANPEWKGLNENGVKKTHIMPVGTVISIIGVSSEVNSFPNLVNTRYSLIETSQENDKEDSERNNEMLDAIQELRWKKADYMLNAGEIDDLGNTRSIISIGRNPKNILMPPSYVDLLFQLNPYKFLADATGDVITKKENEAHSFLMKRYRQNWQFQDELWNELIELYNNEYDKPHYIDYRWIDGNLKKVIIQGVRPKPDNPMPTLEQELRKDVLMWDD